MNNKIITIEPKTKEKKGFAEYLSSTSSTGPEQTLNYISNEIKNLKITVKDSEIVSKIIHSYKKIIEGTELNPYDFILKNQELLELRDN